MAMTVQPTQLEKGNIITCALYFELCVKKQT